MSEADEREKLAQQILPKLHAYKYGKTAMQAGKTMRRTEGHDEAFEIADFILADRKATRKEGFDAGYSAGRDAGFKIAVSEALKAGPKNSESLEGSIWQDAYNTNNDDWRAALHALEEK